ncbi:MAG: hypothetical protein RDV48_25465 [Candidatus Eremiobacteraeota bacterium]|nr:hypothetical protein [Candidatus Eremiobacteraeota bacterium]
MLRARSAEIRGEIGSNELADCFYCVTAALAIVGIISAVCYCVPLLFSLLIRSAGEALCLAGAAGLAALAAIKILALCVKHINNDKYYRVPAAGSTCGRTSSRERGGDGIEAGDCCDGDALLWSSALVEHHGTRENQESHDVHASSGSEAHDPGISHCEAYDSGGDFGGYDFCCFDVDFF